jgi:hypothetical protein
MFDLFKLLIGKQDGLVLIAAGVIKAKKFELLC